MLGADMEEEDTRFVSREGNVLFWVDLLANGTRDGRTLHAGLPLLKGRKMAMGIWPKTFCGRGKGEKIGVWILVGSSYKVMSCSTRRLVSLVDLVACVKCLLCDLVGQASTFS